MDKDLVDGQFSPRSGIYRCVPPTLEYGTRPFLRWVQSQGRSPHASGKAKNTFGSVGIPLFGAPQVPGNKKPGGMAPWGRRKSPVPRHTRQNRPEVRRPTECNPTTGEERPHTNALANCELWFLELPLELATYDRLLLEFGSVVLSASHTILFPARNPFLSILQSIKFV